MAKSILVVSSNWGFYWEGGSMSYWNSQKIKSVI